jgi:hypothetical protein
MRVKLIDFGIPKRKAETASPGTVSRGIRHFPAPELSHGVFYSFTLAIRWLGITICRMVILRLPSIPQEFIETCETMLSEMDVDGPRPKE